MTYDFDQIRDRRNTNSMKWDVKEGELPMWVADMDFPTAPAVQEALKRRVESGIFGYSVVPEAWYEAFSGWWGRRHGLEIPREWLIFCTGVVPAVSSMVKRLTNVGDNVLVQTPVYDIFFHSIENHGRHVLESRLSYQNGTYEINFEDLEEKLAHPLTTLMILCNPHNPVGKIWTKEELSRIAELCRKHHVTVLSDEIHCDLTAPGFRYVPFASVDAENSVSCISATKAFNLAGLQSAAVAAASEELRNKVERGLNSDEVAEPNAFATEAVIAAFRDGEGWLEELRAYLWENRSLVAEFLKTELPEIRLVDSNATYLLWLDCGRVIGDAGELCRFIRKETGLYLSAGSQYRGNGGQFMRMNVACPRSRVEEGLRRLKDGVRRYQEWVVSIC